MATNTNCYGLASRATLTILEYILDFGITSGMDSLSTAIDHVSTSPATQDPRNLANVPPEILQLVFKLVFEKAAVFCTCNPPLCLRHHATEGSWGMLLTCRRFYQEGLEIWHEAVVLHTAYLLLDHLPKHMVEHCKHVRLTSLFIEGLPTYSLEVEREAISKFQHLEMLELPRLEPFEYAKPGRIPDDQEVLQLYNDSEAAYAEWAKEIIECSPKLTVKFWKDLYINNIIDMYLVSLPPVFYVEPTSWQERH